MPKKEKYYFSDEFKHTAKAIAETLVEEGMLFGYELEQYIKDTFVNSRYKFIDDKHYLLFEEIVFNQLEKFTTKYELTKVDSEDVEVYDTMADIQRAYKLAHHEIKKSVDYGRLCRKKYRVKKIRVY